MSNVVRRIAVRPHKVVLHYAMIIFCGSWIVAMYILGVPWLGILSPALLAALPFYIRRYNRPYAVCGMDERRADIYELPTAELAKLLNEQRNALQGAPP